MSARLQLQDQVLSINGSITFDNAAAVYEQGLQLLDKINTEAVFIDLAELDSSNTIALAVFVQWLRQSSREQGIYLQNVPQKMQAIIEASNLASTMYLRV